MNKLPALSDYNIAVQSPSVVFFDSDLKSVKIETNPIGLPKPYSGGFAITYKSGNYAVRCFHRYVPDLQIKYEAISNYLKQNQIPFLEHFDYQTRGITVAGKIYPIVKMKWISGQSLTGYIESKVNDSGVLLALADQLFKITQYLEENKIAHGDLQHGNIIVGSGKIKLIDYDGMFVPGMERFRGHEKGHVNYQHPSRDESHFGPEMDRFSTIIIYIQLLALSGRPDLWRKYHTGENIIFSAKDYTNPDNSAVFKEVRSLFSGDARICGVIELCKQELRNIPQLDMYLKLGVKQSIVCVQPIRKVARQYKVIQSSDIQQLIANEGAIVEVFGLVEDVHIGIDINGNEYCMINFGDFKKGCFTVCIWPYVFDKFSGSSVLYSMRNEHISVTGLLQKFKKYPDMPIMPQIHLEKPQNIKVLITSELNELLTEVGRPIMSINNISFDVDNQNTVKTHKTSGLNKNITFESVSGLNRPATPAPSQSSVKTTNYAKSSTSSSTNTTQNKGTNTGNDCFVATATFGSTNHEVVQVLRCYRDEILAENLAGKYFIKYYYKYGPIFAMYIIRYPTLKLPFSVILKHISKVVKRKIITHRCDIK